MIVVEKKVSYDDEYDIFYVNMGEKSRHSVQIDDFVIDYSSDEEVVGLEVMNASQALSNLSGAPVSRDDLEKVEDAELRVEERKDAVYITLLFSFERGDETVKEHVSISIPRKVPA